MKLEKITSVIEAFAPLSYQDAGDNAGLAVGFPDKEVTGALFCVDITEDVVDEAIDRGINLVISHHPIIFYPLKRLDYRDNVDRVIIKAIRNDIALYSCHTNLDSARGGLSDCMARMLGLNGVSVLEPRAGDPLSGFGAIGVLEGEMPTLEFLQRVKGVFGSGVVRHSRIYSENIRTVAVCSGAGSYLLPEAIAAKADVFVTADVKHHQFLEAAGRITIADIGHFESEYCSIGILHDIVKKNFPKFAACKSRLSTNPVEFI